ncbi:MAG: glycosyltransferase family 4 protein [bacterium]
MSGDTASLLEKSRDEPGQVVARNGKLKLKRKFKVVHIITQLELGGAQRNTLFTVKNHDRERYEVFLITNNLGMLNGEAQAIPDMELLIVPQMGREIRPIADLATVRQLTSMLSRIKPDIVHTHSSKAGIAGRWAARNARVPIIIHTVHGWPFHRFQSATKNFIYTVPERICAHFTDKIITVSKADIEKGLRAGIGKRNQYTTIRSGIDFNLFEAGGGCSSGPAMREKLGISPDDFVVSQVNSFKPGKNNLGLVEVAAKVVPVVPNAKFVIVGDGVQRPLVEAKIRELNLEKNFILTGWQKDIEPYISAADVVTLTTFHEGLPQVCAQAMWCRKPMVMNAVDGIPEACINGQTGFLVLPGNTDDFAKKLCLLAGDPVLRAKLGEQGRAMVYPEWDAMKMVERIESVYFELLLEKGLLNGAIQSAKCAAAGAPGPLPK